MTIGVVKGQEARERELESQRLDDRAQNFQVDLTGTTSSVLSEWTEIPLDFAYVFVGDENARDTPYDKPNFTFGVEMLTEEPVIIAACVTEWVETDEGDVTGVIVKAASYSPGLADGDETPYRAKLHLTFTGYCGPIDGPDDDEE